MGVRGGSTGVPHGGYRTAVARLLPWFSSARSPSRCQLPAQVLRTPPDPFRPPSPAAQPPARLAAAGGRAAAAAEEEEEEEEEEGGRGGREDTGTNTGVDLPSPPAPLPPGAPPAPLRGHRPAMPRGLPRFLPQSRSLWSHSGSEPLTCPGAPQLPRCGAQLEQRQQPGPNPAFGCRDVVRIYRAMLMAGSPAPSLRMLFKDFPLQLRPSSSLHWWDARRASASPAPCPPHSAALEAGGRGHPGGCFS
ncbi:uncharacterized protein ACIB01_015954 [Guaruba guarouba]